MTKPLLVLMIAMAVGNCAIPGQYFGTVDPLQYRDSVAKLNSLIACLLKISPCHGRDANIQARAAIIIASSCGDCDTEEKAVIHNLFSLIAQKNAKILKAIFKRYDLESHYGGSFLNAVENFPTKANILNVPNV